MPNKSKKQKPRFEVEVPADTGDIYANADSDGDEKPPEVKVSADNAADDEFPDEPVEGTTAVPVKSSAKVRKPRTDDKTMDVQPASKLTTNAPVGRPRTVVAYKDTRKLNSSQKKQLQQWRGSTAGVKLDAYFSSQVEAARRATGHRSVFLASEAANTLIGIPTPSLAFEYLIGQDAFPLGLILHLNGLPASNKTSLLCEFYRWFVNANGGGVYLEAETKYSPDLMPSIVGYDTANRIAVERCDSVEHWQQMLQYWVDTHKKGLEGTKAEPGPGRVVPILFGVDSIMGKASWETQEKVQTDGYAGRAFPVEALSITTFMRTIPQMMDEWPFALVLNNHLKVSKDEQGMTQKRTAGGAGVNFQESWEIQMSVVKPKITCADPENPWEGKVVKLHCSKNSMGTDKRSVEARMLWWDEVQEDGSVRQKTVWDWDWAMIKMFISVKGAEAAKLQDVLHIEAPHVSPVENDAWSKTLGMKAADAIPWSDLGARIRQDTVLYDKIRQALGIKRRPYLAGDYLEQLESLRT